MKNRNYYCPLTRCFNSLCSVFLYDSLCMSLHDEVVDYSFRPLLKKLPDASIKISLYKGLDDIFFTGKITNKIFSF